MAIDYSLDLLMEAHKNKTPTWSKMTSLTAFKCWKAKWNSFAHKQGLMEHQFNEFSGQQAHQVASLQQQLNAQGQQLHGQIESQKQSIQAMFENQLAHIRGLLSKRPRDDGQWRWGQGVWLMLVMLVFLPWIDSQVVDFTGKSTKA